MSKLWVRRSRGVAHLLSAMAVWTACGGKPAPPKAEVTPAAAPLRGNDELLALAPAGTQLAVAASGRALGLIEDARTLLRRVGDVDVAVATWMTAVDRVLPLPPGAGLADLGLTRERGFAWFSLEDDRAISIWPVTDRARFVSAMGGHSGPDGTDTLAVGDWRMQCRDTRGVYACADRLEALDRLGTGSLAGRPALAGARGDVEVWMVRGGGDAGAATEVAANVVLEPGQFVARLRIRGDLPPEVLDAFTSSATLSPGRAAGFFGLALPPSALEALQGDPMVGPLVAALRGTMAASAPSGVADIDVRIPLRDAGPIQQLLEQCDRIPLPPTMSVRRDGDGCVLTMTAPYAFTATARIESDELRISRARGDLAPATGPEPTAFGRELADGAWNLVAWGRGNVAAMLPPGRAATAGGSLALSEQLGMRVYSYVNELGVGLRVERDGATVVVGARTLFANPAPVVDGVLAILDRDLTGAQRAAELAALARAHPSSPLADDHAAGPTGLMLPVAGVGVLAAVAIPQFLDYMSRSKVSEAEVNLAAIQKAAMREFADSGAFPTAQVGPTPAAPCCEGPNRRCPVDRVAWDAPGWQALDFVLTEPSLYRYAYRSDGKTMVATATGDLDCDGTSVTFTLYGRASPGGQPEFAFERPSNPD